MADEKKLPPHLEAVGKRVVDILKPFPKEDQKKMLEEVKERFEARTELSAKERRKKDVEKKLEKIQRQISWNESKLDDSLSQFMELYDSKNEDGKTMGELLTETGIHRYVLKHEGLKKELEKFFEERDYFKNGEPDELTVQRGIRATYHTVYNWLIAHDFDHDEKLKEALEQIGFENTEGKEVATIVAVAVAREAFLDHSSTRLQQLHYHKSDYVDIGRDVLTAFKESIEVGLTGKAKEIHDRLNELPPWKYKQLRDDLIGPSKTTLEEMRSLVLPMFMADHPVIQPEERSQAFMELFARMEEIFLKERDWNRSTLEQRENALYVITERIFRDAFMRTAEREVDGQKVDVVLDGEKMVEAMKADGIISSNGLWTDQELQRAGAQLWEKTYKLGLGDDEVVRLSRECSKDWERQALFAGISMNERRKYVLEIILGFTAKWAVHAYQRITTTHTYAAALMCTDTERVVLEDIEMQWHAFMVCVPNGLLKYKDNETGLEHEYNRILVASFDEQAVFVLLNQAPNAPNRIIVEATDNIAKLLDSKVEIAHTTDDVEVDTRSKIERIVALSKRLIAGLLLALQNQNNFKIKQPANRDGKKYREKEEPSHRVVFLGKPLNIDCRPAVSDFINHGSPKRKGAPPQVQTLVRGHHKRQVMGVGRSLRKVIWVEPYWRGPDDAPILTRPKEVH